MHQFFQGFSRNQPPQQKTDVTPELRHNVMVFEICNNWEHVIKLIKDIGKGRTQITILENEWYQFLLVNNINIESYENEEDFMKSNERALAKK